MYTNYIAIAIALVLILLWIRSRTNAITSAAERVHVGGRIPGSVQPGADPDPCVQVHRPEFSHIESGSAQSESRFNNMKSTKTASNLSEPSANQNQSGTDDYGHMLVTNNANVIAPTHAGADDDFQSLLSSVLLTDVHDRTSDKPKSGPTPLVRPTKPGTAGKVPSAKSLTASFIGNSTKTTNSPHLKKTSIDGRDQPVNGSNKNGAAGSAGAAGTGTTGTSTSNSLINKIKSKTSAFMSAIGAKPTTSSSRAGFFSRFSDYSFPTKKIAVDGITYTVADLPNAEESARLLHRLNMDAKRFVSAFIAKHGADKNPFLKDICDRLKDGYDINAMVEHIPSPDNNLTAYTDDKGVRMGICLRGSMSPADTSSNLQKYHDYNTLMFVLLHEISHIGNISYDHDERFWRVFAQILKDAVDMGMYTVVDYKQFPIMYCDMELKDVAGYKFTRGRETFNVFGVEVNYNPLLDKRIQVY